MFTKKYLKTIVLVSVTMFLICGLIYPLTITLVAQVFFPSQANGSIVYINDKAIGSELIGQTFTDSRFMKSRPSAVNYNVYSPQDILDGVYGGVSSGSKNFAPSNPALAERVKIDMENFLAANPTVKRGEVPADLLTASGSGLDPHISPASAEIQIIALSESTGLPAESLRNIVKTHTKGKLFGVFGEETVNVLMVNIDIAKSLGLLNQ